MGHPDPEALIEVVVGREHYLDFMTDERQKCTIIEAFDVSRSTVDRDVRLLEDASLVERGREGYRTTPRGRLALVGIRKLYRQYDGLCRAWDAIPEIYEDCDLCVELFEEPTVTCINPKDVDRPGEHVCDLIEDATRVRCLLTFVHSDVIDVLGTFAEDDSSRMEIVLTEETMDVLAGKHPDVVDLFVDAECEMYQRESLPHGLVLADRERVALLTGPSSGSFGVIANDDPSAVSWGNLTFAQYCDGATRLA